LDLAQFLCSEIALEPWDDLSRSKYLGDARAILAFLSGNPINYSQDQK
jgi:hypothetical protein